MANPEHLAILKQGVEKWNEWRRKNPNTFPNLRGADLRGTHLGENKTVPDTLREATP